MTRLTVGQELWAVFNGRHRAERTTAATVTKVGRKWAAIKLADYGESRVDMETLRIGDEYTSGRGYLSREHYEAERAADDAWTSLWRAMYDSHARRPGLSASDINAARILLGIA